MNILGAVGGLLLGGAGRLLGIGGKQVAGALPPPTRDDARAAMERGDLLARRKGAAADMMNGTGGAELTGRVGRLVVGN